MKREQINRINELARKAKTPEGLTEAEQAEQAVLRRAYIDSVLGNLKGQLDHTYLMDEQGRVPGGGDGVLRRRGLELAPDYPGLLVFLARGAAAALRQALR